jgi:hypothetical protein
VAFEWKNLISKTEQCKELNKNHFFRFLIKIQLQTTNMQTNFFLSLFSNRKINMLFRVISFSILILNFCNCRFSSLENKSDKLKECQKIKNEIDELFTRDQNARASKFGYNPKIDSINIIYISKLIDKVDTSVFYCLDNYYFEKLFIVALHSPLRSNYIIYFKNLVQKEKLAKYHYAKLIDKCLIELTGRQQYGTQYFISDNKKVLLPIIDILKIDSLRSSMDLTEFKYYIEQNDLIVSPKL